MSVMRAPMLRNHRHRPRSLALEMPVHGFQIAPMVDVVFVIMLFFMVMAGALRAERQLSQRMPRSGGMLTVDARLPVEVVIGIDEDGEVTFNDEALDRSDDRRLTETRRALHRLSQLAMSGGEKVVITLDAQPQASFERIVDVLNVLSAEHLQDVTFAIGEDS